MQTFVVEVLDDKAVPLLENLENLHIIRLLSQPSTQTGDAVREQPTRQLSDEFRGSISKETAADLHRQLDEMRNEWERDI